VISSHSTGYKLGHVRFIRRRCIPTTIDQFYTGRFSADSRAGFKLAGPCSLTNNMRPFPASDMYDDLHWLPVRQRILIEHWSACDCVFLHRHFHDFPKFVFLRVESPVHCSIFQHSFSLFSWSPCFKCHSSSWARMSVSYFQFHGTTFRFILVLFLSLRQKDGIP